MNKISPLQQFLFDNDLIDKNDTAASKETAQDADPLEKIRETYKVFKGDIEKIVEIKSGKIIYQSKNKEIVK